MSLPQREEKPDFVYLGSPCSHHRWDVGSQGNKKKTVVTHYYFSFLSLGGYKDKVLVLHYHRSAGGGHQAPTGERCFQKVLDAHKEKAHII